MRQIYQIVIVLFVFGIFLIPVYRSYSKVYVTKDQILKEVFRDADRVEQIQVFLTDEQIKRVKSLSGLKPDSRIYIFYKAIKGKDVYAYAAIDTHWLRTKTETVLYVIEPDGRLKLAEVLAFFEPTDYKPSKKWVDLFKGKKLESARLGREIPVITGATITSYEFTKALRKILAIFEVAVKEQP